jgi:tetratricopeptide (TPR) repeat protein
MGREDEAERFAGISRDIADEDDVLSQVVWRGVSAKSLARRGEAASAIAVASEAVQIAAATVDIELHADALTEMADVLELAGQPDGAPPRLREALALYELKGDVVRTGAVRTRLGEGVITARPTS